MPTIATFRVRFPRFATISDAVIQAHLAEADWEVSEDVWGDRYELGVMLYACHTLTLENPSIAGGGGNVTGRSVGDVSVSFKGFTSVGSDADWFNQTQCGQRFLMLSKQVGMGIVVVPTA